MIVGYSSKVDAKCFGVWTIPHRKPVPCSSRDALERITIKACTFLVRVVLVLPAWCSSFQGRRPEGKEGNALSSIHCRPCPALSLRASPPGQHLDALFRWPGTATQAYAGVWCAIAVSMCA